VIAMPKFAVYYITPSDSSHYRHGSNILGYDVRAGKLLPKDNQTRALLPEFNQEWIQKPQTYGFHVTTGYSLYFDKSDLPHIEAEIESVCRCFGNVEFTLTPQDERVVFWRDSIVVLPYFPNINMAMLHTMLIARINPFGTASNISQHYTEKLSDERNPTLAHRVEKYYTPYMLDGWNPHFTLMMPYTGTNPSAMKNALQNLFDDSPIQVESICLMYRDDHETHYRLYREYHLEDY
jgi:hypothetical protein